jgi:hypothetical protein
MIIGAMVLTSCSASQLNEYVSTATIERPSLQASRTPKVTKTPGLDRETQTSVPTRSSTPTLDVASYANVWTRYHGNYGISFEYPSIYDELPFHGICEAVESLDGADFGEKSEVYVRQPLGTTLDEHVKAYLANLELDESLKLESQEEIEINNQRAIAIEYKLGEAGNSRKFVFVTVPGEEVIFTFSFIGGSACDVPEIGLSERTVFEHAVKTFSFEE